MTELDDELLPEVLALIEEVGKQVSVVVTTPGTPDPTTGGITGGSSATHSVKASPPYPVRESWSLRDTTTQAESACLLAGSGLPFTPKVGDRVTFDSVAWKVLSANAIYSGEQICAWELGLVRGTA